MLLAVGDTLLKAESPISLRREDSFVCIIVDRRGFWGKVRPRIPLRSTCQPEASVCFHMRLVANVRLRS